MPPVCHGQRGGADAVIGFRIDAFGTAGKYIRKLIVTSQNLQLITGTYRMALLENLAEVLESAEGQAILKSHMTVKRRIGRDIDGILSWLLLPFAPCLPEECRGAW